MNLERHKKEKYTYLVVRMQNQGEHEKFDIKSQTTCDKLDIAIGKGKRE